MPCYLFTYHAYGSWMPDRPEGYVRRGKGVLPPDSAMAKHYREAATASEARFESAHQRVIIESLLDAASYAECEFHGIATEPSHVHALVSWRSDRDRVKVCNSLRGRVTRELGAAFGTRPWLARDASRRQVKDRDHFDYLVQQYLPKHSGLKWSPCRGIH